MNFNIQYENPNESLLTRLFKVRGIQDNVENFLNPKLADYWLDPFLLNDMGIAVDRIIRALKNNEKIMIFGDYDVDGVTSSWAIYKFITKFLNYRNVSVQYPDRIKDGYGMKNNHIDEIKNKGVSLIITVDNGIASVNEVLYAKEKGIDVIITDHHKEHDEIPQAFAVVNPQISSNYEFKGLAGVGVAFKLINAILSKSKFNADEKNQIFNYFLPIVAIGTVADVVPLIHENRVIVKNGLDLINNQRHKIPSSLSGFLNYLNLKKNVDTFHIGFVIGPRINAGGRIQSPYDSLNILLYSGKEQHAYLEKIDEINTERRKLQETAFKIAEEALKHQEKILIVSNDEFHEGIVGIVAGRIAEKYNKPSVIFKIDKEKNMAVASLRGPGYFDIMDMLSKIGDKLLRFGGHKHAGGLAVDLDKLDEVKDFFENYCRENIKDSDLEKSFKVDTKIYSHEWNNETLNDIEKLAPFGEGNKEPVFLIENFQINKIEKVGKNGNGHMKMYGIWDDKKINSLFRGKGSECDKIEKKKVNLVGKARKDSFNGGYFLDGVDWR
ncbi:single-stranded-DNA-specific exonuclease RecJ [Candidatus Gracilibacteria bacterium]|nr:single-stranded-DNA-specific exonuclease RecJ [Candidatus Gracilibacteria bacterium]